MPRRPRLPLLSLPHALARVANALVVSTAALALSIFALAVPVSTAGAFVVKTPSGHRLGVTLHRGISPQAVPGSIAAASAANAAAAANPAASAANPAASSTRGSIQDSATIASGTASTVTDTGQLNYNGGPVLHTSTPYLIFWDPNNQIASSTRTLLSRYFGDVASGSGEAGNVYGVDRQYTDSSGYASAGQTFSASTQTISDTQSYPAWNTAQCPASTGVTMCLTDTQVQSELIRLIAADGLPSGTGADAPIYFVVLPPTVDECYSAGSTQCSTTTFCAYHSSYGAPGSQTLYAVIPTLPAAQNAKACQWDGYQTVQEPNADVGDVVLKYLSHEDNETITDPLGSAWYDSTTGAENGDECNSYASSPSPSQGGSPNAFGPVLGGSASAGTLYDQLINGDPYYIQTEWSNGDGGCLARPAAATLTPSFSVAAAAPGSATSFDPGASVASRAVTSATWDFGDGSAPRFVRGTPGALTHTYATAGLYTARLTLVDGSGDLATVSQVVAVGTTVPSPTPPPPTTTPVATPPSTTTTPTTTTPPSTTTAPTTTPPAPVKTGTTGTTGTTPTVARVAAGAHLSSVAVHAGRLWVRVSGPGTITLGRQHVRVARARQLGLRIALSPAQRRTLARDHRLKLVIRLTFKPADGRVERRTVRLTLRG